MAVGGAKGIFLRLMGWDTCPNEPEDVEARQIGVCHVCKRLIDQASYTEDTFDKAMHQGIGFCPICCHWFCRTCAKDVFGRAWEAIYELVGGPQDGCCGPLPDGARSCMPCQEPMRPLAQMTVWICPSCGRMEERP